MAIGDIEGGKMFTLLPFILIMFLLLLPWVVCWRIVRPKRRMSFLTALLMKEIILGTWRALFGAKKVRIVKRRRKR